MAEHATECITSSRGISAECEAGPDDACPGGHKDLALGLHQSALPAGSPHRVILQAS